MAALLQQSDYVVALVVPDLVRSVCFGVGLVFIQHFQFVGAFLFTRHGGDVGALRTACCSRCQLVSFCFLYLVAVRFAGAWHASEERTQGAGNVRTES